MKSSDSNPFHVPYKNQHPDSGDNLAEPDLGLFINTIASALSMPYTHKLNKTENSNMKSIEQNPDGLTVRVSCLLYSGFYFIFFFTMTFIYLYMYIFFPSCPRTPFFFPRIENEIGISV